MPTYEYKCSHCGHLTESFQSITASPKKKCPKCGKLKLKRLMGIGAGIIFKGNGFYETDYRSDSYKKGAESEKKSASDTKADSKKETKKTDSKPTTKSEKNSKKNLK
ncbi:MAG: zinc ribbon domain-containing protein [Planctomycetes bacterium]|nr:zinc ribbon domain-containing protein [Planctomycetota bacterium]